ncbi:MAG: efflux RND transporter periplasmic adaptor subunit [Verrucomicrobiales bacterium]|nr:efflux RND transporter periplasmic adaptor subunit [Verrucomicrobiales bacterium]
MKKFITFLVIAGIAGGAWFYFKPFGKKESAHKDIPEFTVQKGDLRINVLEGGNIQALEYLQIKNQVKASTGVKILKVIEEGYEVTKEDVKNGKILVKLDASTLEEKLVDHDVEFQQTESQFADARQDIEIAESDAQSRLKSERQALRFALLDFEKYVGKEAGREILSTLGLPYDNETLNRYEAEATEIIASAFDSERLKKSVLEEIEEKPFSAEPEDSLAQGVNFSSFLASDKLSEGEAEQLIRKMRDEALVAASQLSVVEQSFAGAQRLRERDFITQQTLDNEEVNLKKAELTVQTKETELDLFLDYEFPKEAQKMLSKYEEALLDLIRSKRSAMALMSKAYARYRSYKRRYELELKKRKDLEEQMQSCIIRAEKPGLVAYGGTNDNYYTTRYYESISEGATLKYGQPIITIPDMSKLGVDVNIHESHIKKVSLDQKVFITAESVPDKVLEGRVSKVAVLPDSNASRYNPSLKVYPATVEISGNNDFLKPGMSAKVEILVSELDDVAFIPVHAVFTEDDEHFVFLKKAGLFDRHVVTIGQHNDQYIEIKGGLSEGDIVALSKPDDYEPEINPKGKKGSKSRKKKKA